MSLNLLAALRPVCPDFMSSWPDFEASVITMPPLLDAQALHACFTMEASQMQDLFLVSPDKIDARNTSFRPPVECRTSRV